jgi:hypothetical protein
MQDYARGHRALFIADGRHLSIELPEDDAGIEVLLGSGKHFQFNSDCRKDYGVRAIACPCGAIKMVHEENQAL